MLPEYLGGMLPQTLYTWDYFILFGHLNTNLAGYTILESNLFSPKTPLTLFQNFLASKGAKDNS